MQGIRLKTKKLVKNSQNRKTVDLAVHGSLGIQSIFLKKKCQNDVVLSTCFFKDQNSKEIKMQNKSHFQERQHIAPSSLVIQVSSSTAAMHRTASLAVALTGNSNNGFHCFQFLLCAHHNCVLKTELPQLSLRLFLSSALQNQMKENDELNFKSYFMYSEHCLKGGT